MINPNEWERRALAEEIDALVSDAVRLHFVVRPGLAADRLAREYRQIGLSRDDIAAAIILAARAARADIEGECERPAADFGRPANDEHGSLQGKVLQSA